MLRWRELIKSSSRRFLPVIRGASRRTDYKNRPSFREMWFSLSFEMKFKVDVSQLVPLDIDLNSHEYIRVTFRRLETQNDSGGFLSSVRCWATGSFQVSETIHAAYLSILNGELDVHPPRSIDDSPLVKHVSSMYEDGSGGYSESVFDPAPLLPEEFGSFQDRIYRDLNEAIERTVRLVHWRSGTKLPRADLRRELFLWSVDDERWLYVPRRMRIGAASSNSSFAMRLNIGDRRKFESMVSSGIAEPIGHDVFLEAWQIRQSVPRAAIVLGIAAAELGLKECIGKLAPDTVKLLEKYQSPPVAELLSNYLPTLCGR